MSSTPSTRTDEIGHQLAMQLRAASAHLRRQSNRVFASFGMTTDQYVLLTVLKRQGEASQEELARLCYSDTATIGTMIVLLESKELVVRTRHPKDRRAWSVQLTPRGQLLADKMRRCSQPLRARLAHLFQPSELALLMELLGRVADALRPSRRRSSSSRQLKPSFRPPGQST